MTTTRWNDEVLDRFGRSVGYSVRVCVWQLATLVHKYGNEIPEAFEGPHEDALLEAGLMHVRALDDFLKSGGTGAGKPPDIRATDWLRNWKSSYWLDPRVRAQIDWQVIHLSSLSGMEFPKWQLADIGAALCNELERFFDEIEHQCPDRLPAFESHGARQFVREGPDVFAKHVTPPA
jgi:hypothetical protein